MIPEALCNNFKNCLNQKDDSEHPDDLSELLIPLVQSLGVGVIGQRLTYSSQHDQSYDDVVKKGIFGQLHHLLPENALIAENVKTLFVVGHLRSFSPVFNNEDSHVLLDGLVKPRFYLLIVFYFMLDVQFQNLDLLVNFL